MEHVTMFHLKALPGRREAVIGQFEKWEREQKPQARGFQRSILVSSRQDPDEFMAVVRFNTSEDYEANSAREEQDAWFRELRENLAADPMWFDGTLVREMTP